jgi:hypothetical protein
MANLATGRILARVVNVQSVDWPYFLDPRQPMLRNAAYEVVTILVAVPRAPFDTGH